MKPVTSLPSRIPNDRRGWLTFTTELPPLLQNSEDATQAADFDACPRDRIRPATDTEKQLLRALGLALPEDQPAATDADRLHTKVEWLAPTLRRRTWPALSDQTPDA
ncbi:Uncharacterised protein [Nocardia otitidiscaviarum]|uniref:Uncharacterized protein n=1 Tax=Nocardia otitidiscaviarum TaxID=1823 RepID=A0A378YE60_9NOCA|nr:hypothetical protein [Nocardia otitidiscaviarum]SUA75384.1 Uncharacterised protein [Nocardia otitidiscaviarum]